MTGPIDHSPFAPAPLGRGGGIWGPQFVWVTVGSVALALALTGWASARFGYGAPRRAVLRNVAGGLFAMAITYGIGSVLGTHV